MQSVRSIRKSVLVSIIFVFAFSLVACGDNGYADAANAALAGYNTASQAAVAQLSQINDNNDIVKDQAWKDATSKVLDQYEAAGKAFASLPEAPDQYKKADALMKEVSFEIKTFVDTGRRMVENEDINEVDGLNAQLTKVNDLITQIDAAIKEGNQ